MRISIKEPLKPFSKEPGTKVLLPGSFLCFTFYPKKVVVHSLKNKEIKFLEEFEPEFSGPEMLVQLNLERGAIHFSGSSPYKRYTIVAKGDEEWRFVKNPEPKQPKERLSLGCHKKQDWDLVSRRKDIQEYLPFIMTMGQYLPNSVLEEQKKDMQGGVLSLLHKCDLLKEQKQHDQIGQALINFIRTSFEGILVPSLEDKNFLGLIDSKELSTIDATPLIVLDRAYQLIRSLFIHHDENSQNLHILPHLPKELAAGRLINLELKGVGSCDLEWTKKQIRRIILRADTSQKISLKFQSGIRSYRLKLNGHDQKQHSFDTLEIKQGQTYFLDRFER